MAKSPQTPGEASLLYLDELFDQDEWWVTKQGLVRIADMDLMHRRKTAMTLLRKAPFLALYMLLESNDEVRAVDALAKIGSPQDWLKQTTLYQRIIQDGADPDAFWTEPSHRR